MNHLDCTTDHPVFVVGKGYVAADSIQPGDVLITPTGTKKVKSITTRGTEQQLIHQLRDAGCPCRLPLYGYRPGVGPRCRLCNTQVEDSSWDYSQIEFLNTPDPDFVYNLSTSPHHNFFANNVLVHNCDDPIDPKRAVSEAELKTAADFVTNILPSRKVDKAVAVTTLVMQRLHELDPSGVLLAKSKEMEGLGRIRHVCLPARLADNVKPVELREKYLDNLMDPVRLPEIVLREQEMLLGAYSFSGQYLQSPVPLSGGMFKIDAFNTRVKAAPYDCNRILYVDRACLVENTVIHTSAGSRFIRDVRVNELVLTREGWRPVLWAGITKTVYELYTVEFTDGLTPPQRLIGTAEHPVWVRWHGWKPLCQLQPGDDLLDRQDLPVFVVSVTHRQVATAEPVYDLQVEGVPEFFANGVLVHNSTQDGGCYTAMVLMARSQDGNSWFIEHCVHGQWEPDERNRRTLAEALRCRVRYGPSHEPHIYIEAEGGSSGRDAFKGVARALAGFVVREHRPTGKKQVRAEPLASQWAAGNIALVDDGTWDINNYIQEHVHFPLGKYMDQVDASSGAFALLVQQRPTGGLRSYSLSHKKKQALRILICTPEQLTNLSTTSRCLLIYLSDPQVEEKGVMSDVSVLLGKLPAGGQPLLPDGEVDLPRKGVMPTHSLPSVLDTLHLQFLNAGPADFQHSWLDPVPNYNVLPEQLLLSKAQCKKLWQKVCLHRDPWLELVAVIDADPNRSLSIGYALCDTLNLERSKTLGQVGKDDGWAKRGDQPSNTWLFEQIRSTRNLVV